MADVTIKKIDELNNYGNQFFYAGKDLGVTSFGLNISKLPANWDEYPDHNHAADGQEEVYIPIEGSGKLVADGEEFELKPGMVVRVGAEQNRKIIPGEQGLHMIMVGGVPDTVWTKKKPSKW